MNEYQKESSLTLGTRPGVLEVIGIAGFVVLAVSTSVNFVPIIEKAWRETPVGFAVLIFSVLGCVFMERKNYFAAFFIAVFSAFFLTHDIIIVYDSKAVEMGKELGPDGWFRPVFLIFKDAFSFKSGAFFALIGVVASLTGICLGWSTNVVKENRLAARKTEIEAYAEEVGAENETDNSSDSEFPVDEWVAAEDNEDSREEFNDPEDDTEKEKL